MEEPQTNAAASQKEIFRSNKLGKSQKKLVVRDQKN